MMKSTLLIIAGTVALLAAASTMHAIRKPTPGAALQLSGSVLLVIMVLAHVAETFSLVPQMGWGRPGTPGHYLDLVSAVAGLALLLAGVALRAIGIARSAA